MSSIDCEQSLFARKFVGRTKWRKQNKRDMRVASRLRAVISAGVSRLCISRSHAHDPPLACVAFFAFFSTDFWPKERMLAVYVLQLVTSENICFFIDFDSRLRSEALLKFEGSRYVITLQRPLRTTTRYTRLASMWNHPASCKRSAERVRHVKRSSVALKCCVNVG